VSDTGGGFGPGSDPQWGEAVPPPAAGGPPGPVPGPDGPASTPAVQQAPGWYPAAPGWFRWWDGANWGEWRPAPGPGAAAGGASNARTLVLLAHLGCLIGGFITPLVIVNVEKQDPFVRDQATEALNFQLTVLIAALISVALAFVLIGFLLLPIVLVANYVFGIMGAVKASRGEWYRYPVSIRMVKP
jgi:uncharacterized protein